MPRQVTCISALPGKTGTRKSHFHSVGLCYTHNAPVRCPERKSCQLWCVWQRLTFVEIVSVRYPNNRPTVHWLSLQAWRRATPIFYTATDIVTDLVNTEHVGNRQQNAMLPSYVWCTQSIVLTVKGCSALTRWYFNCVSCFLVKSMQHLSEKMQFLGFLFPQVVQKQ